MLIMSLALLSGKSTISVLMLGTPIEETRFRTAKYIGDRDLSILNSHAIFLDYSKSSSGKKYIIALGNKSRENEIKQIQQGIEYLRKLGNLIVYYLGFNTIERYRGSPAIQEAVNFVNSIIDYRDIAIGVLLPGSEVKNAVINMASTHIKIVAINNTTSLYGIFPKTNLLVLEPD